MKKYFWILFFIFPLTGLAGCVSSSTQPSSPDITIIAPSPTVQENGYPGPTVLSAYPPPSSEAIQQPLPTAIPQTPDPNLGVVKARLLLLDQPAKNIILYLAHVITSEAGGRMVRFERTTSIRTVTDEMGNFMFINVSPGEYGIVIDRVIDSYLLLTPGGESLIVTLSSNEEVDLGDLSYEDLPLSKEETP